MKNNDFLCWLFFLNINVNISSRKTMRDKINSGPGKVSIPFSIQLPFLFYPFASIIFFSLNALIFFSTHFFAFSLSLSHTHSHSFTFLLYFLSPFTSLLFSLFLSCIFLILHILNLMFTFELFFEFFPFCLFTHGFLYFKIVISIFNALDGAF